MDGQTETKAHAETGIINLDADFVCLGRSNLNVFNGKRLCWKYTKERSSSALAKEHRTA